MGKRGSMFKKTFFFFFLSLFFICELHAFSLDEGVLKGELETRAVRLFKITRCMICSGESLYDSQSSFAREVRALIRKEILKGMEDDEILSSLRERYGMQILAKTPYGRDTYLLWVIPAVVAVILVIAMFLKLFMVRNNSVSH
ncbi:cytochrome c-type biogenesis protein [Anaplasma platys]|uniref:cytochrome c-type biogenesis protein n=1 Tax=Anaplasma platys TaxID=949 RepID=UPI001F371FCA|nr:cytochrome c-type biogenesis protein CcmH [Anaplasma platys]